MVPWFGWIGFLGGVAVLLTVDLLWFHRRAHQVHAREALVWSACYVAIGLGFAAVVAATLGGRAATEYLAGYVIEWSLSVDNIFVFVVILAQFAVPAEQQQRVLQWGVMGAVVLRLLFIVGGATVLHAFEWAVYVFGALLLLTAFRLVAGGHGRGEPERSMRDGRTVRTLSRLVPITEGSRGGRFLVRERGRIAATPLLVALALVVVADVVFAVDSIPAIFGVTRDAFVAFTSNALAVMGLRPLYFVLADAVHRFRFLRASLAAVLGFVGLKMIAHEVVAIPTVASLAVVVAVMGVGVAASWRWPGPAASAAAR
jgi:tellurite resistance protein TerC